MNEILFIAHRMPFPPDRGDKIRSHHLLTRLARIAPVHVACFGEDGADMAEEVELAALARSYRLVRRAKPLTLAGVEALARGEPVSSAAFRDRALALYIDGKLAGGRIGTIFVFSGQMGQYVPADWHGRLVIDFCDVDSAKFEAYAASGNPLRRWLHAREARLLRDEENRLAARADVSLLISEREAALFRARAAGTPAADADVRVIGNGVDSIGFNPAHIDAEPRLRAAGSPRLIFTGQMDYAPNIAAAIRAGRVLMPAIRAVYPEASLHIVGRKPTDAVCALDGRHGVRVWGAVEDIRPWLKAAEIALVPLEIARGVQNKVLEAMAMALPVVLTSDAATGIEASDGEHFVVADSDDALVAAVVALAGDPERRQALAQAARYFAAEQASWASALAPLRAIVLGPAVPRRDGG